jgi:hypothetical protein
MLYSYVRIMQLKVIKERVSVLPWKFFCGSLYWSLSSSGIEREGLCLLLQKRENCVWDYQMYQEAMEMWAHLITTQWSMKRLFWWICIFFIHRITFWLCWRRFLQTNRHSVGSPQYIAHPIFLSRTSLIMCQPWVAWLNIAASHIISKLMDSFRF